MTAPCPICATPAPSRHGDTPYWACPNCGCWFQAPLPPKACEAAHEAGPVAASIGPPMSEHERGVHRTLAEHLFQVYLRATPGKTLDVGSRHPYLAHCLRALGCDACAIDAHADASAYARELGVPMLRADFEDVDEAKIRAWAGTERFRLITLVHAFEHLYDPLAALRKLRRLVADDGALFLRLPDHQVAGYESLLSSSSTSIPPYCHALGSVLELLAQGQDLFTVALTVPLDGAGQRDLVLAPLTRKPVLHAAMIVKNEERDLPRCLASIEAVVDGVVLVDTGSTDRTLEVAQGAIAKPVYTQTYTGASRQDERGDWKLWDFGQARNVAVDGCEHVGTDFVLWMDADDELLTPAALRRALYWHQFAVFGVQIESGGMLWTHHRLWQANRGIRFEGRCHEYPVFGDAPMAILTDCVVRHDHTPGTGESGNERNLRILADEWFRNPTSRTAFYLANNHRDAGRYPQAIEWYARRIAMDVGYRDEWLFAYLYKARCERAVGNAAAAEATLLEAVSKERGWAEFWVELAYIALEQQRWRHALGYAQQAVDAPVPMTLLWREPNKYMDQPCRVIASAYEGLGEREAAREWAERGQRWTSPSRS